jgi:pilus assembly protein CpaE
MQFSQEYMKHIASTGAPLRGVIIGKQPSVTAELETLIADIGGIAILRKLKEIPTDANAGRMLAALAPHVIFAEGEANELKPLVDIIRREIPGIQVIAWGSSLGLDVVIDLMHLGIREYLCYPFRQPELVDALARCRAALDETPVLFRSTHEVFTFVPAKAGVGSSTIALNVSAAMANDFGKRTLLADFDLTSGIQRFMSGLGQGFSVIDAIERSADLDEALWPQLISSLGDLDILHAGQPTLGYRIESDKVLRFLDFARRGYEAIVCDVSGNLELFSTELMRQSKRIFLVCTPEVGALHLAREKLAVFRTLDMEDRVNVLVNRIGTEHNEIGLDDVERLIGRPAFYFFPNDYKEINRALKAGKLVRSDTGIGRCYSGFAKQILDLDANKAATKPKRRLIQFFRAAPRFVER